MRLYLWKAMLITGLASLSPHGLRNAGPWGAGGRGLLS